MRMQNQNLFYSLHISHHLLPVFHLTVHLFLPRLPVFSVFSSLFTLSPSFLLSICHPLLLNALPSSPPLPSFPLFFHLPHLLPLPFPVPFSLHTVTACVSPIFWHVELLKVILVLETKGGGDDAATVYASAALGNCRKTDE